MKMHRLDHFGSIENAINMVNTWSWQIVVERYPHYSIIYAEETEILRSTDNDIIDAFLYGMALACEGFPEDIYLELMELFNKKPPMSQSPQTKINLDGVDKSIQFNNLFGWELSFHKYEDKWLVTNTYVEWHPLLTDKTDTTGKAFIYGMALVHAAIPDDSLPDILQKLKEWFDSL